MFRRTLSITIILIICLLPSSALAYSASTAEVKSGLSTSPSEYSTTATESKSQLSYSTTAKESKSRNIKQALAKRTLSAMAKPKSVTHERVYQKSVSAKVYTRTLSITIILTIS